MKNAQGARKDKVGSKVEAEPHPDSLPSLPVLRRQHAARVRRRQA